MTIRERIWGEDAQTIEAALEGADPDLARYVREFAYEEVMARPGLDLKTRELLAVAMLIALGNPREISTHLAGALRVGATEVELRETIIHAALYVGFPRALGAMKVLEGVLRRRGADDGAAHGSAAPPQKR